MSKLIALCGAPGAGKSEVQRILFARFDVHDADDGWPLRDFAMRHCGAKLLDVYTQAGKAAMFEFPGGKRMTMREFLGEFGNAIEAILGPDAIPEMALMRVRKEPKPAPAYSFGSTRRQQGHVFKKHGAIVVEVVRPGVEIVNEFDRYDRECIDFTIHNMGTVEELERDVVTAFGKHLRPPPPKP